MSLANLSDSELLSKISRRPVDKCRDLLNEHKSLHGLLKKTDLIDAAIEMASRYYYEELQRGEELTTPTLSRHFLKLQLDRYPHEVFAVIFMDNRNRVIAFEKMFFGTIDGASVYPREVVKKALDHNAAAVVFAHNHPSGVAEPSNADEMITGRLKEALGLVDIRVLDHFVIGDEIVSFAERGLI